MNEVDDEPLENLTPDDYHAILADGGAHCISITLDEPGDNANLFGKYAEALVTGALPCRRKSNGDRLGSDRGPRGSTSGNNLAKGKSAWHW